MENNFKNKYMCKCITEPPCCAPETLKVNYIYKAQIYL